MTSQDPVRSGGCACGAVRFTVRGAPLRTALCHCLTCRKAHGAPFNAFAVFRREQVDLTGDLATWQSSHEWVRRFCPRCGARVVSGDPSADSEVELALGSFDEPGWALPQYEAWTGRREPWLTALSVPQYEGNRTKE